MVATRQTSVRRLFYWAPPTKGQSGPVHVSRSYPSVYFPILPLVSLLLCIFFPYPLFLFPFLSSFFFFPPPLPPRHPRINYFVLYCGWAGIRSGTTGIKEALPPPACLLVVAALLKGLKKKCPIKFWPTTTVLKICETKPDIHSKRHWFFLCGVLP